MLRVFYCRRVCYQTSEELTIPILKAVFNVLTMRQFQCENMDVTTNAAATIEKIKGTAE